VVDCTVGHLCWRIRLVLAHPENEAGSETPTCHAIMIARVLRQNGVRGPFLVIGPLSTLPNWINEFQRFCPGMPALMYHGSRAEREELRRTRLKVHLNQLNASDVSYARTRL
jgi:SNF2 family DNA or RNA helicase